MSTPFEALRIAPHALDAEQAVLGALMLDSSALAKVADFLGEEDFYRGDHRAMFRAIGYLAGKGDACDPVTMADWFENNGLADVVGGSAYLVELANGTPSTANIVAYAEIVVEKARLRSLIDIGTTITESAYGRGGNSGEIVAEHTHRLSLIQPAGLHGGLAPAKAALTDFHADLIERYSRGPGLVGMPSPWQALNKFTKGLRNAQLIVVGARPSMGKSVFGGQLAVFAALRDVHTALFSVEMSANECMGRALACTGEVPYEWVDDPLDEKFEKDAETYWPRLTVATQQLMASPLKIDDTPSLSIDRLKARARRVHLQRPIGLLVIDHLHDMAFDPRREKRDEIGRAVQGIKDLAKEFNCPAVLMAQLNRAAAARADKRPTLTDLREAGAIEEKADLVFGLHREDYYDPNTHLKGVVEVIPLKGRGLKLDTKIIVQNRFDQMRMDDWTDMWPQEPLPEMGGGRGKGWGKRSGTGALS